MKTKYLFSILVAFALSITFSFSQSAKLIVYRPASIYGSLAKYQVNVDDKEVATLKSKSMYQMDLSPGNHTVSPKQSTRAVTINAQAGQTYVVKFGTPLHILGARPKLKVIPFADAQNDSRYNNINGKKEGM